MEKITNIFNCLCNRRTIRRFKQEKEINPTILDQLIQVANLAPHACNLQAIEYLIVKDAKKRERISNQLNWATDLDDHDPKEGQQPSCYIIPLINKKLMKQVCKEKKFSEDLFLPAEYISLGASLSNICNLAFSKGIGSCILALSNKKEIIKLFNIKNHYILSVVIALGYPDETPQTVNIEDNEDIRSTRYYKGEDNELVIPKINFQRLIKWQ